MPNDEKPYLSHTQINEACMCGERYRRHYVEREKLPPGPAAIRGSAFHRPIELNFRQKLDTHADLPAATFEAMAAAEFDRRLKEEDVLFTQEEKAKGPEIVLGDMKDAAVAMAGFFAVSVAPEYQPLLVEQPFRIPLPVLPRDICGRIDLVDDRRIVPDFKSGKRKKGQADVDHSVQLTIYALAVQQLLGEPPSEVRLENVVKYKTKIERQTLVSHRDEEDFGAMERRAKAVCRMLETGSFPPAPPGAWWCSPNCCSYWSSCGYVNAERRAAAEE